MGATVGPRAVGWRGRGAGGHTDPGLVAPGVSWHAVTSSLGCHSIAGGGAHPTPTHTHTRAERRTHACAHAPHTGVHPRVLSACVHGGAPWRVPGGGHGNAHVCTHMQRHTRVLAHCHPRQRMCRYTSMRAPTHVHAPVRAHTPVHAHTPVCAHPQVRVHAHARKHAHAHVCNPIEVTMSLPVMGGNK